MSSAGPTRIGRRIAIKWIMAAGAGAVLLRGRSLGAADSASAAAPPPGGYGADPDLTRAYKPGDYWPLTFTDAQRSACGMLCDIILPADARSASASSVGVGDFVDEWVSAPYPDNARDRKTIVEGLAWLDGESARRYGAVFAGATSQQREALCADIAVEDTAAAGAVAPSRFFRRFRDLVAAGYYTTPAGMREIGYVGNVPLATFDGPPANVIEKLGLSAEVAW